MAHSQKCIFSEPSSITLLPWFICMEHAVITVMQFAVLLFLVSICSKRRKADHTKSAASDRASEMEKKNESLTTARPSDDEQYRPPSSVPQKGKVTKMKLRDLADEPSLSRSKLQGSSELETEELQKEPIRQTTTGTPSQQPPSPQAHGQEGHDKHISTDHVTQGEQDTEPTQCPGSSPMVTRTEDTPPSSLTERTGSTSTATTSKESPGPLQGDKLDSAPSSIVK